MRRLNARGAMRKVRMSVFPPSVLPTEQTCHMGGGGGGWRGGDGGSKGGGGGRHFFQTD